jgi:hypothetical protein
MPNEKVAALPDHLAPLLEPTPSGVAKLVAAWEGLSTELQILILTGFDKARLPAYLKEKVCIKALDGANAYVRYLAARELHFSDNDTDEKKPSKSASGQIPTHWSDTACSKVGGTVFGVIWQTPVPFLPVIWQTSEPFLPCLRKHDSPKLDRLTEAEQRWRISLATPSIIN